MTRLPRSEDAFIPPEKFAGYLLPESHPIGKAKARVFRGFGYDEGNVDVLGDDLLTIAATGEVEQETVTPHGTNYVVVGMIETPIGRPLRLRTVWIIEAGEERPRSVTAYPD